MDLGEFRLATPADNAGLLALLKAVHMPASLDMTQERDPDFFALPRLHSDRFATVVLEIDGQLEAMGSMVVREGWVDGERATVGYQCDVRATRKASRKQAVVGLYRALEEVGKHYGVEAGYFAVIDSNLLAKRSIAERFKAKLHCPYEMVNVQLRLLPLEPSRKVGPVEDLEEFFVFLAEQQKKRQLGYCLTPEELDRRFKTWPGLKREHAVVVREGGKLVGATVLWDSEPVKRTRVLGYHQEMAGIKRWYDRGAALFGYPRLPEPGECFRFLYMSMLEAESPGVLADLVRYCWREVAVQKLHFLAAMVPRQSPLQQSFKGFYVNRTAMSLYTATIEGGRFAGKDFLTQRPGFEMCLV